MITLGQLTVYEKYKGNPEGLDRAGSQAEKALFPSIEWGQIDLLLVELRQARDGLLASEYKARLEEKMVELVDGPIARAKLESMV